MAGIFITFEGLDKAGKSTQISLLAQRLQAAGRTVFVTREPGGTPLCEELRNLVMQFKTEHIADESELLLFAASRAQLVRQRIWPELEAGHVVLCDRFADSTLAYQGYARGLDLDFIRKLNDFALGGRWPDRTILLDLTVEESFSRLAKVLAGHEADSDRFEDERQRFHQKVREGFLAQAAAFPERIKAIPATQSVEAIAEQIWSHVEPLIKS